MFNFIYVSTDFPDSLDLFDWWSKQLFKLPMLRILSLQIIMV